MALVMCCVGLSWGQWTTENVDNGLDDPYKIAYTASNNGAFLKLESMQSSTGSPCDVMFYISGGYHCDEKPLVNISFLINGVYEKYTVQGYTSEDSKTVFFGMLNDFKIIEGYSIYETTINLVQQFKSATSVKIRINESHCEDDYYEFSMSGSSAAYNFMTTGCSEWKIKEESKKKEKEKQDSLLRIEKEKQNAIEKIKMQKQDSLVTSNNIIDSVEIKNKYPIFVSAPNTPIWNKPEPFTQRMQLGKTISDSLYDCSLYVISYYTWSDPGHYKTFIEVVTADFKIKGWIDSFFLKNNLILNKYINDGTIENKNLFLMKLPQRASE